MRLLGPGDVRRLAGRLGIRPDRRRGQNFVVDPGTVTRIAALARIGADDTVLEVGPGLGSLTLALLPRAARVVAVEIDPVLAAALPETVAARAPGLAVRLEVVVGDAVRLSALPGRPPTLLVANLPYNVAVPVVLHLLAVLPSVRGGLVMVQAEVADRMVAPPGSRVYGAPSAKLAWFASARRVGSVGRSAFWPVPRVDSALVALRRHAVEGAAATVPETTTRVPGTAARVPGHDAGGAPDSRPAADRAEVFGVIDAAFGQRRKTLRAALAGWAGSASAAERVLRAAGIEPGRRGESLGIAEFARIAAIARDLCRAVKHDH